VKKPFFGGWMSMGSALLAGLLCIPTLIILAHLFVPMGDTWNHLVDTVLVRYLSNTALLALGVGLLGLTIGAVTAWLCAIFRFPGHGIFHWALLLPLAVPTYATAFSYAGLCEFSGPIQTLLREVFGWAKDNYWFPEVRSIGGAVFVMAFVLYPYVYLLGRTAFVNQAKNYDEMARTLGRSPFRVFRETSLPLARPSLIAGTALMLMETLSDFGAVQHLAVDTFTTGVYRTWFALGSPEGAARLASMLLLIMFLVLIVEQRSRGRARYYQITGRTQKKEKIKLKGFQGMLAAVVCFIPVLFGFVVPAGYLLVLSLPNWANVLASNFPTHLWNSFALAVLTSLVATMFALFVVYSLRLTRSRVNGLAVRVVNLGYGLPGSVIAVGVLIPMSWLDHAVDGFTRSTFGYSTGLIFTGGLLSLMFAYLVRFMAISLNSVQSSMDVLSPRMDEAGKSLGAGIWRRLFVIHIPLLSSGLLTGLLLVFVDVMKELPATLILRPFNYDTLAVKAYEFASDEALSASACYALTIVAVGLIPVVLLSRSVLGFGYGSASMRIKNEK